MRQLKVDLIRTMDERDRRESLIVKLDKEATNLRSLTEIYENDMKLLHDKIERTMYDTFVNCFYTYITININNYISYNLEM